jgi:hypothetical protein
MAQATLNGLLEDDGGLVCKVRFEWGGTREYGEETPWQGGFTSGMAFNTTIYNLTEGRAYHFRAVAINNNGISYGNDMTFTTLSPLGPVTLIQEELAHLMEVS